MHHLQPTLFCMIFRFHGLHYPADLLLVMFYRFLRPQWINDLMTVRFVRVCLIRGVSNNPFARGWTLCTAAITLKAQRSYTFRDLTLH